MPPKGVPSGLTVKMAEVKNADIEEEVSNGVIQLCIGELGFSLLR